MQRKTGVKASSLAGFPKDSEGLPHLPGTIFIGDSDRSPRGQQGAGEGRGEGHRPL